MTGTYEVTFHLQVHACPIGTFVLNITADLFDEWLLKFDEKFGQEHREVLLLVDNCSPHDPEVTKSLTWIKLEFLPPNCTSKLQPCDLGIVNSFKVQYRKKLLQNALLCMESGRDFNINVLDCMRWCRAAWENDVSVETISSCFRKAGFTRE